MFVFSSRQNLSADDFLSQLFQEVSVYVLGWENRIACIKKRNAYYLQRLLFLFYCVVQRNDGYADDKKRNINGRKRSGC